MIHLYEKIRRFVPCGFKAVAVSAVLTLAMASCEYKDFGYYDGNPSKVRVGLHFDWKAVDSIPRNMRVVFYPEHYEAYSRGYTFFDVFNRDTVVEISEGKYNTTCWNNDTEYVITSGFTRQKTAYATTGSYSPHGEAVIPAVLDSLFGDQPVLDYPDYMVHARLNDLVFKRDTVITLVSDSMVVTVDVRLNGIRGTHLVRNIRCAVSNVAGKRYMAFDNRTEDLVAVMFDGRADLGKDRLTAHFWIFGKEPSDERKLSHRMVFFVWLDNAQVYIPLDITDIMAHYSKEDRHILIDTKDLGIDLTKYAGSGGMTVNADDWQDTQEITIGF